MRAGAALGDDERQRLRALNTRITALTTQFGNRVLAEANGSRCTSPTGPSSTGSPTASSTPPPVRRADQGRTATCCTIVLPTIQPAISSLTNRDVRRRVHEAATTRGLSGGDGDTRELVGEITALRAERAALLGFTDHAAYVVADQTAGTSKAVLDMLDEMAGPAMANLEKERARIEELLHADGVEGPVEPWDWAYYAARDLAATYDVDTNAVKPWFELQRVLHDGIFFAASQLYGVSFRERDDLPAYAEDVRVFEVFDGDGGTPARAVRLRLVRPAHQARRRLDVGVRRPVAPARHAARRGGLPQRPEAVGRPAGADDHRRGPHRLPRVRPRAARAVLRHRLPPAAGHRGAARLRRVPLPGQRDVGLVARGGRELRRPPRDR